MSETAELLVTEQQSECFVVDIPFPFPEGMIIDEFQMEIVRLQQNIIDSLNLKLQRASYSDITRLKAINDAMVEEREEIISSRDRARAETAHIRDDRNKIMVQRDEYAERCANLESKHVQDKAEIERLTKELRIAKQELEGVPQLIENRVASALANASVSSEQVQAFESKIKELEGLVESAESRRSQAAAKNAELDSRLQESGAMVREQKAFIDELSSLARGLLEFQRAHEVSVSQASSDYESIMAHVQDLHGYLTLVCAENDRVKNDNLHLTIMHGYEEFDPLFARDSWAAFVYCKPTALQVLDGDESVPDHRYGMSLALNLETGEAHFVYIGVNGELCIPETVNPDVQIPEKYRDELTQALKAAPLDKVIEALEGSVTRARNITRHARILDIEWSQTVKTIDVAKKLHEHVPEEKIKHVVANVERAKQLVPRNEAQVARINKRFGSTFTMADLYEFPSKAPKPKSGGSTKASKKRKRK